MDKARLRQVIIDRLNTELDNITRAALMARDEATHEESKPENQYDMHAQEAAYLAEGQAKLAAELHASIALIQGMELPAFTPALPIALGAIVTLETAGRKLRYFLSPRNGGLEVICDGLDIIVITPQSPIGRQLIGRKVGDPIVAAGRPPQKIVAVD
jgi:transcription elongation GreA/GreB family factor